MDVLQDIDVGLVILNREFEVKLWNSFMQNHSAKMPEDVLGHNLFELFPDLPKPWFERKAESVFVLQNAAFTTWEQRPYLFKFKNYRPITSIAKFMYQNSTIIPLTNVRSEVEHICIILYDVTEVAVNRLQLQDANNQLHTLSRTDGLTGLLNRKTWEQELELEFKRFQRHPEVSCLIMFDIDHFKRVNDTYGHPTGDAVIRETAKVLMDSIRDIDIAGRYGGEEFTIILTHTNKQGALVVAERIRTQMESITVTHDSHEVKYTVSLGIAEIHADIENRTAWIERADRALYQAKDNGRNNSVIFED